MGASLEVQSAFMTLLQGDTTLMGHITGVFDEVPVDNPFPYISLGSLTEQPWTTFGHTNADILLVADIWYEWAGDSEGLTILNDVQRICNPRVKLTLPNYFNVQFRFEWSTTMTDQENTVGHIPFRYHVLAEEK